ncbi:uncharacterized protein BJ171DRAFT_485997 [Polychytrium aggregatum]|uniref:uncharacterized protein n=1 Tax=Polychytrium aggregatum TaxID=110093 RepID=UPI0022FDB159|nr:uncharacterized protein BJ171DRAFT_485997 [Polychytrium aggregatum]KAI9209269.1 hypothetical protein BJ171DRAFT_485997 [Polychytrium aggregatum]
MTRSGQCCSLPMLTEDDDCVVCRSCGSVIEQQEYSRLPDRHQTLGVITSSDYYSNRDAAHYSRLRKAFLDQKAQEVGLRLKFTERQIGELRFWIDHASSLLPIGMQSSQQIPLPVIACAYCVIRSNHLGYSLRDLESIFGVSHFKIGIQFNQIRTAKGGWSDPIDPVDPSIFIQKAVHHIISDAESIPRALELALSVHDIVKLCWLDTGRDPQILARVCVCFAWSGLFKRRCPLAIMNKMAKHACCQVSTVKERYAEILAILESIGRLWLGQAFRPKDVFMFMRDLLVQGQAIVRQVRSEGSRITRAVDNPSEPTRPSGPSEPPQPSDLCQHSGKALAVDQAPDPAGETSNRLYRNSQSRPAVNEPVDAFESNAGETQAPTQSSLLDGQAPIDAYRPLTSKPNLNHPKPPRHKSPRLDHLVAPPAFVASVRRRHTLTLSIQKALHRITQECEFALESSDRNWYGHPGHPGHPDWTKTDEVAYQCLQAGTKIEDIYNLGMRRLASQLHPGILEDAPVSDDDEECSPSDKDAADRNSDSHPDRTRGDNLAQDDHPHNNSGNDSRERYAIEPGQQPSINDSSWA